MASNTTNPSPPRRIMIYDSMRTRSHLFFRYLSTSPEFHAAYHPFIMATFLGEERWALSAKVSPVRRKEIETDMVPFLGTDTIASLTSSLRKNIATAEAKNLTLLSNEHIFNIIRPEILFQLHRDPSLVPTEENWTLLPSDLYPTFTPLFLIRHPVPKIDSTYRSVVTGMTIRASDEDFEILCSYGPMRRLFDHYRSQGVEPIVVDGDDIVFRTEEVKGVLAAKLGVKEEGLRETWEEWPEEDRHENPLMKMFLSTIYASRGIERPEGGKRREWDLEETVRMWEGKYGGEEAGRLRKLVEVNMPHWEYLNGFKV